MAAHEAEAMPLATLMTISEEWALQARLCLGPTADDK